MFLPLVAMAEIIPSERPFDPRVRLVDYNPFDVVRVTTFYGVSTYSGKVSRRCCAVT